MKRKTKKFSILEVIVVAAIISSLMSILISTIQTSKNVAVKATCMSNISQIRNFAELYRKDNNSLPYSEVWMTDFSWVQNYTNESALDMFNCPGDKDAVELTTFESLKFNTSYFYVPSSVQLEKNLGDGLNFGVDASLLAKLKASQDAVIYDNSPDNHNGSVNIAFLFKSDDPDFNGDANTGSIASIDDPDNSDLISLLDDGTIELPDVEVPVADPVADEEEEAEEPGEAVTFNIVASAATGGTISPSGSSTFDSGDNQTYTITPDTGSSSEKVKSNNGHGNNEDGVDSSNPGNSKKGEDSDPNVDDESKSNGSSSSSESSTKSYAILDVLVDGVSVGAVSSYTFSDIDNNHTISATFIEITEEEETTVAGKSNNGHGNNEDGVDSSNPGNSKAGEDSDPDVDDESKGGSSSSSDDSDSSEKSNNGNGNSKSKKK